MFRILVISLIAVFPSAVFGKAMKTQELTVQITKMADELFAPWAIAFLPDGSFLITERDGDLYYFKDGNRNAVSGVPKVFSQGQGGLLDIVTARNFAKTREVFITYSEPVGRGARTAMGVARLSGDNTKLVGFKKLYAQKRATNSTRHFGSRVVEAENGDLFVTVGDRGERPLAQSNDHHNGKVMRVSRAGKASIHSMGHRNPQGAALDDRGEVWTVEHGPRGGDEINKPKFGLNYGWPIISYGRHYTGGNVGEGNAKVGYEQPMHYWDPSIAPSGMMIYYGDMFPEWQGDIFVGSLKFDMISRNVLIEDELSEAERLFTNDFQRIRDIRQAPDGSIWFLAVGEGAAYRISR